MLHSASGEPGDPDVNVSADCLWRFKWFDISIQIMCNFPEDSGTSRSLSEFLSTENASSALQSHKTEWGGVDVDLWTSQLTRLNQKMKPN